jgi:hypothetical protein
MTPLSYVSRAALAAGVPARYRYWLGRSGRRYLFTCTDVSDLAHFELGVAIAVMAGQITWTGDIATLAAMPASAPARNAAIYVHLLAATPEERQAVVEDLKPIDGSHLRLAA